MIKFLNRLGDAIWSFKQPLTHIPSKSICTISDLFVWRNSNEWKTFFEIFDVPALFQDVKESSRRVSIVFFDPYGNTLLEEVLYINSYRRHTIELSKFLNEIDVEFGTFAVFHHDIPHVLGDLGAYITERGYVSYGYKNSLVRSYVHGNLDAIARHADNSLELLGGFGFLKREFRLQYSLEPNYNYEFAVVNTTSKNQIITWKALDETGKIISVKSEVLASKAVSTFKQSVESNCRRIVLGSHLVMARPLVFKLNSYIMDVFHG